ncbi:MAG: cytochrome c oxidase subunit II [Methyloligellaceae bacterium]
MITVLLVALVAIGSVVFHLMSPWWWTPIASNWGFIDTTIIITFWVTGVVFVAIVLFVGYCIWKFRYQEGRRAEYEPENPKLEWWLTVLTSIGVVVMLAPGLLAWNQFITVPKGAAEFEVLGQQWQWNFRLPGKDGVLGKSDTRNVSGENPFGLDPNDPKGKDDILIEADDLHLQLGKPVKVLLRSIDVLHNFYVPQFRGKMDMIPGMVTYFWFTPTRAGTFDILCAELCGVGHHAMRGSVVVDTESDYQAWLQEQQTFAQTLAKMENSTGESARLAANGGPSESPDKVSAR